MRYRGVDDKSNIVKGKQVIAKAMVIARIVVARNHRGSLVFEREKSSFGTNFKSSVQSSFELPRVTHTTIIQEQKSI